MFDTSNSKFLTCDVRPPNKTVCHKQHNDVSKDFNFAKIQTQDIPSTIEKLD
jgi:hypothetical protein